MCKITIKISWVPFFNRVVSGNSEKSRIAFISFSSVESSFSFFSKDKYYLYAVWIVMPSNLATWVSKSEEK